MGRQGRSQRQRSPPSPVAVAGRSRGPASSPTPVNWIWGFGFSQPAQKFSRKGKKAEVKSNGRTMSSLWVIEKTISKNMTIVVVQRNTNCSATSHSIFTHHDWLDCTCYQAFLRVLLGVDSMPKNSILLLLRNNLSL